MWRIEGRFQTIGYAIKEVISISDEKRRDNEYPNHINPNANPSATLAIERAKLAMSLAGRDDTEAGELREALLDRDDLDPEGAGLRPAGLDSETGKTGLEPDKTGPKTDGTDYDPSGELHPEG